MCNLSWTPHCNLEKDNSLKTTPVLAQRWAVRSILTKNLEPGYLYIKIIEYVISVEDFDHVNEWTIYYNSMTVNVTQHYYAFNV